jgi:hypothetical protein
MASDGQEVYISTAHSTVNSSSLLAFTMIGGYARNGSLHTAGIICIHFFERRPRSASASDLRQLAKRL